MCAAGGDECVGECAEEPESSEAAKRRTSTLERLHAQMMQPPIQGTDYRLWPVTNTSSLLLEVVVLANRR